jgi:hypothetical protein
MVYGLPFTLLVLTFMGDISTGLKMSADKNN